MKFEVDVLCVHIQYFCLNSDLCSSFYSICINALENICCMMLFSKLFGVVSIHKTYNALFSFEMNLLVSEENEEIFQVAIIYLKNSHGEIHFLVKLLF